MKLLEAIKKADELRLNDMSVEAKADFVESLDGNLCDIIGEAVASRSFPEDRELTIPFPHDNVYVYYLTAMIDYYNGETGLYANDMEIYNNALSDALASWRRTHRPSEKKKWVV